MIKIILFFLSFCLQNPSFGKETSGKFLFKVDPYAIRNDRNEILLKFQLNIKTYLEIKVSQKIVAGNYFPKERVHEINLGVQECDKKIIIEINKEKSHLTTHKKISIPPFPCDLRKKISFGFLGDTQQYNSRHKKIAKMVSNLQEKENLAFILNLGDVVNYGIHKFQWDNFFNVANLYSNNSPMIAAIGNHEYYNLLAKIDKDLTGTPNHFKEYFRWKESPPQGYFYLNMKKFGLIVINSNFDQLTEADQKAQWLWIENTLKQNEIPTIVAMHFPPFSSDSFNDSPPAKLLREKLVPLLEKYQVKLVLSGHTHLYERLIKNGINYIVTGPSGGVWGKDSIRNPYQVFKAPRTLTFGKISFGNDEISLETFNEFGIVIDRFSQKI